MIKRVDIVKSVYTEDLVLWKVLPDLSAYAPTLQAMEDQAAAIAKGAPEEVWLLEHPSIYTAGTSAKRADLIDPERFPVFETGRGGQFTYHGPGQRVAYVMLDLKKRGSDIRAYVAALERWLIATLAHFGIAGETREDRVGVWVKSRDGEAKIAALGVRIRRGVSLHGISINVDPDLTHFDGIVPCGVAEHGVTSFAALGHRVSTAQLDVVLRKNFDAIFAPTRQ
jgi:lipoyl(octanoyl) transferase